MDYKREVYGESAPSPFEQKQTSRKGLDAKIEGTVR